MLIDTTYRLPCFFILLVFRLSPPFLARAETSLRDQFLWLSDVHLDPFYGTHDATGSGGPGANCFQDTAPSNGQRGCDAPSLLVDATLKRAAVSNVSFVILTGDLCRHGTDGLDNPLTMTQAILANVSHLLRQYMPNVSIIPSLGNNDVTPDYYLDVKNPTEMLTMAAQGLNSLLQSDSERTTFLKGGFFARNTSETLTLLSFNTLLYSTSHVPNDDPDEDPLGQFAWLESQLIMAMETRRSIYIVGHIPPAMGSYHHSQLWQESYLHKYYSILQNYASVISGQFFGHLHSDEFRWIPANNSHWPLWIASSVTPIYGSNPSYRLVSYHPSSGDLLDYDTWYLDLLDGDTKEWKLGPSFRDSFDVPDLSLASIHSLVQKLNESLAKPESTLWEELLNRQHIYIQESAVRSCQDQSCRQAWLCTLVTITADEYATCLARSGANPAQVAWARLTLQQRLIMGCILIGVGMIASLWCLCSLGSRYLRRRHYQQTISLEDGIIHEVRKDSSITIARSSSMDSSYLEGKEDGSHTKLPSIT